MIQNGYDQTAVVNPNPSVLLFRLLNNRGRCERDWHVRTLQSVAKVTTTHEFVDQDLVLASAAVSYERHQVLVMHHGKQLYLQPTAS